MSNLTNMIENATHTLIAAHDAGETGATHYFRGEGKARRYVVGGCVPPLVAWSNDVCHVLIESAVAAQVGRAVFGNWEGPQTVLPEAVGFWLDEDHGTVHFDVSETWDRLDLAMGVARDRGEIAIWDRLKGEEVNVSKWHAERNA